MVWYLGYILLLWYGSFYNFEIKMFYQDKISQEPKMY